MSTPRTLVEHPEFPMPGLDDWQARETGLPSDFWEAFDAYFSGVADLDVDDLAKKTQEAEAAVAEGLGLNRDELLGEWSTYLNEDGKVEIEYDKEDAYCDSDYGWQSYGSESRLVIGGPTADLVREMDSARSALREAQVKSQGWQAIVSGSKPVWSFLPGTRLQKMRADNVENTSLAELRKARAARDDEAVSEIEARIAYYRDCWGWPGGDISPQWSQTRGRWMGYDRHSSRFLEM